MLVDIISSAVAENPDTVWWFILLALGIGLIAGMLLMGAISTSGYADAASDSYQQGYDAGRKRGYSEGYTKALEHKAQEDHYHER